jgi:hypothetical protein
MHDSIKFNDKEYEIKQKLTFGDVRKYQKSIGNLIDMQEKIKTAKDEELEKILTDGLKTSTEEMDLVAHTITKCLGFTQEELDSLSFPDAVVLFNEIYTASTTIKKKLNQPYA